MKALELMKILKRLEISQVALALELCVSEATVSRWLRGSQVITPAMAKYIRLTTALMDKKQGGGQ